MREREIEWAELMQSANAGDSAAYQRLLLKIAPVLRAIAEHELVRAGLPIDCREAIVQEILLAVQSQAAHMECESQFCTWLFTIVRNKLLVAKRRAAKLMMTENAVRFALHRGLTQIAYVVPTDSSRPRVAS